MIPRFFLTLQFLRPKKFSEVGSGRVGQRHGMKKKEEIQQQGQEQSKQQGQGAKRGAGGSHQ